MASRGAPPAGMEQMGLISPLPLRPHRHRSSRRSVSLSLPVPGLPACLASPAAAPGLWCHSRGGGVSPSWGERSLQHFPPGAARGHECCHGSSVICQRSLLDFGSLVWICLPHALIGSGARSLFKVGGAWQYFCSPFAMQLVLRTVHFVWEEGHAEGEGGQAGRCAHLAWALSWGWGPGLCEAELQGWPL